MKNDFSISKLSDLKSGLETIKKEKLQEHKIATTVDNTPLVSGKNKGVDFLLKLKNSVDSGRPNAAVNVLTEYIEPVEGKKIKPKAPLTQSRGVSRDEDDAMFDEEIKQRMAKARNKIQESAQLQIEEDDEPIYESVRKQQSNVQETHSIGNGGMITEQKLFELAQSAINGAMAELYMAEKIKEGIREGIIENKNEIKKIVYQTLKELRELNESKKTTK